jgi:hypothetical protein
MERKPAPHGYPYDVSDTGQVRRATPEHNTYVGKVLRQQPDKDGYLYVVLSRQGMVKTFKVHALVCWAFHGPRPADIPDAQVRHLNGVHSDNRATNLCWGTAQDNADDRKSHGRQVRGEQAYQALFTQQQVNEFRALYALLLQKRRAGGFQRLERGTLTCWAEQLGVSKHTLTCVLHGRGY